MPVLNNMCLPEKREIYSKKKRLTTHSINGKVSSKGTHKGHNLNVTNADASGIYVFQK